METKVLECHACGREIGDILLPGVLIQMPLFPEGEELAWCNKDCFSRDSNK